MRPLGWQAVGERVRGTDGENALVGQKLHVPPPEDPVQLQSVIADPHLAFMDEFRKSLKIGDHVMTGDGIIGEIIELDGFSVRLKSAGSQIEVWREAITDKFIPE